MSAVSTAAEEAHRNVRAVTSVHSYGSAQSPLTSSTGMIRSKETGMQGGRLSGSGPSGGMSDLDRHVPSPYSQKPLGFGGGGAGLDMLKGYKSAPVLIQVSAPLWEGTRSPYTTFNSTKSPAECIGAMRLIMDDCAAKKMVDFETKENSFVITGRMYTDETMSVFELAVYRGSDEGETIIEIRQMSGDSFAHDQIFTHVTTQLKAEGFIEKKTDEDIEEGEIGLVMDYPGDDDLDGDADGLPPLDSLPPCRGFGAPLPLSPSFDDSESESVSISMDDDDKALAEELIIVCTDRDSFREEYRECSAMLARRVNESPAFASLVKETDNILERLIKPLCDNMHDTLVVRNILRTVKKLISSNVKQYDGLRSHLLKLHDTWTLGVTQKFGEVEIRFIPSQQCKRLSIECMERMA